MQLSEEQVEQLEEASAPLLEWLNANCHPHCQAIVTTTSVEVLEGLVHHKTFKFVRD